MRGRGPDQNCGKQWEKEFIKGNLTILSTNYGRCSFMYWDVQFPKIF